MCVFISNPILYTALHNCVLSTLWQCLPQLLKIIIIIIIINIIIIVLTFLFQFIKWEGSHYQREKQLNMHKLQQNHLKSWKNLNTILFIPFPPFLFFLSLSDCSPSPSKFKRENGEMSVMKKSKTLLTRQHQGPVVRKVENVIHGINFYPVHIHWIVIFSVG